MMILFILLFCGCKDNGCTECLLEMPSIAKYDELVYYRGFVVSFNSSTHVADWVAYELTEQEVDDAIWPRSDNYRQDKEIYSFQADSKTYKHSGWHRGHFAPACDMKWDSVAMSDSFYYTNIGPQTHELNQGVWQSLENKVRKWAKQYGNVYVCCGTIYTTGKNGYLNNSAVKIPDSYYKALLIPKDSTYSGVAFVMPNDTIRRKINECFTTIDALEKIIGRNLFCNLDKDGLDDVESVVQWGDWGLAKPNK